MIGGGGLSIKRKETLFEKFFLFVIFFSIFRA